MRPSRLRLGCAVLGLAALVAASCGSASNPTIEPTPTGPAYRPSGSLLLEVGTFSHQITAFPLPSGPQRPFDTPFFGAAFGGGFWGPDGHPLAMVPAFGFGRDGHSRLFRLTNDGAREVGRWLPGTQQLDLRGHWAAAFGCFRSTRAIWLMDLQSGDDRWQEGPKGCSAALSPDAKQLAYVDGGSLFAVDVPSGTPKRLLDLHEVPGLREAGVAEFGDGETSMAWGSGGIAVGVGNTGGYGIVVYRANKKPQVIGLGSAVPRQIEWQPDGNLLGFSDFIPGNQIAEMRLFDPATGGLTQVAAALNYGQFKWSPDGQVLALVRTDYIIAFIDVHGRTLTTLSIRGIPDDWQA